MNMEEANLVCKTPSHSMALRQRRSKDSENQASGSPMVIEASASAEEGLIGGRLALNVASHVGLTGLAPSLESKAGRQLRTVKRAWGTFKAKMKPSGRKTRGARRQLLDLTVSATPRTPEGVLRLLNTPLPLSTVGTPRNARRYRDPLMHTPCTPMGSLRRSERIAQRTPTPMKTTLRASQRQKPRRLQSPGTFQGELNRVTSQLDALTQGMMVFEAMETGITKSIARQESNSCVDKTTDSKKEDTSKKELKGKCNNSLTSLKENFQKRLKKQLSDVETTAKAIKGEETKENNSDGSAAEKMQRGRFESSLSNLKDGLQRSMRTRKRQHPTEAEKQANGDDNSNDMKKSEGAPLLI